MSDVAISAPIDYGRAFTRYRRIGIVLLALFGFGFAVWATTAPLSSAVIAVGRLDVDGSVKRVQHETGGTVAAILVSEGQHVDQGQPLLRLDDTSTRAALEIVSSKLDELWMSSARLRAERDGSTQLALPEWFDGREDEPGVWALMSAEQRLMTTRLEARDGQKQQLAARISQLENQIEGLDRQKAAKLRELELTSTELNGGRELMANGIVSQSRVNELERATAELEGEIGQIEAQVAEIGARIAETRLQALNIDQSAIADAGRELSETTSSIADQLPRRISAADQLARTEVRAPSAGVVHQLAVHTVGGVIGAGELLMTIVPSDQPLNITARISPADVESVYAGQEARVRFPGLNHATTPELDATVRVVGADLVEDPVTRQTYYPVTLDLAEGATDRLESVALVSGMTVEAYITGTPRNFLDYLIQPIRDRMGHALREQ